MNVVKYWIVSLYFVTHVFQSPVAISKKQRELFAHKNFVKALIKLNNRKENISIQFLSHLRIGLI